MSGLAIECLQWQIAHAEDTIVAIGLRLQVLSEAVRENRNEASADEIRSDWKRIVRRLTDIAIQADDIFASD